MPPCPQPWRLRFFYYAMGEYAREEYLKVHGVHPDQRSKNPSTPEGSTEVRMPGGAVGLKRTDR